MIDYVAEIGKKEKSVQPKISGNTTQQKIIDRFIRNKDQKIPPAKKGVPLEDLSKESTQIGEFLLTESLAEIYMSQGKTGKAIEIYKKLIWKFPQKKAYFASQIEKLKKG